MTALLEYFHLAARFYVQLYFPAAEIIDRTSGNLKIIRYFNSANLYTVIHDQYIIQSVYMKQYS